MSCELALLLRGSSSVLSNFSSTPQQSQKSTTSDQAYTVTENIGLFHLRKGSLSPSYAGPRPKVIDRNDPDGTSNPMAVVLTPPPTPATLPAAPATATPLPPIIHSRGRAQLEWHEPC